MARLLRNKTRKAKSTTSITALGRLGDWGNLGKAEASCSFRSPKTSSLTTDQEREIARLKSVVDNQNELIEQLMAQVQELQQENATLTMLLQEQQQSARTSNKVSQLPAEGNGRRLAEFPAPPKYTGKKQTPVEKQMSRILSQPPEERQRETETLKKSKKG